MVEQLHRTPKAALMAKCNDNDWTTNLPWILLGLRTMPKEGSNTTAAEMTYGDNPPSPGRLLRNPMQHQNSRHPTPSKKICAVSPIIQEHQEDIPASRPSQSQLRLPSHRRSKSTTNSSLHQPISSTTASTKSLPDHHQRQTRMGLNRQIKTGLHIPRKTNKKLFLSDIQGLDAPYVSQLFLRREYCAVLVNVDIKTQDRHRRYKCPLFQVYSRNVLCIIIIIIIIIITS